MKTITSEKSVIHGTQRAEDLIPAFLKELKDQEHPQADEFQKEWDKEAVRIEDGDFQPKDETQGEYVLLFTETLMDALHELVDSGLYFGHRQGDTSDFGFWKDPWS